MTKNRILSRWVHRLWNGAFGAALIIGLSSFWFGESPGTWRHFVSRLLLWASIPTAVILAIATNRFSIVEGVAGDAGYDQLETNEQHERSGKKKSSMLRMFVAFAFFSVVLSVFLWRYPFVFALAWPSLALAAVGVAHSWILSAIL